MSGKKARLREAALRELLRLRDVNADAFAAVLAQARAARADADCRAPAGP
jgi:hypothetical protein